jgi:hypothetical protein
MRHEATQSFESFSFCETSRKYDRRTVVRFVTGIKGFRFYKKEYRRQASLSLLFSWYQRLLFLGD